MGAKVEDHFEIGMACKSHSSYSSWAEARAGASCTPELAE